MAASWEPYFANALEVRGEEMALGPDEPKDPKQWRELDPLTRGFLESQDRREVFDDWLGWTYVSWRRLARRHRYQARVERALVSTANSRFESYSNRTGRIYSVAVGERYTSPDWRHYLEAIQPFGVGVRLCALLYSDVLSPMFVDSIQESEVWADAGIKERAPIEHDSYQIIAIPRISFMRLRSVSATPTMSSAPSIGHHIALQVGKGLYGQSAAGVLTSGSAAMFVDRTGHNDPCLLGARHVFGPTGSSVVDAAQNSIGSVSLDDLTLDASVVDLTAPWVVDYRLPGLNIIPGAPIMPYVNMPVQMFGAKSGHQAGYVTQTNYTAPSQPGASIANNILTSITAQRGDSGALLCSGYHAQPAIARPYLSATPPQIQNLYICAALGILQGRANQGVGPIVGLPSVFTLMPDILAALTLDPLTR